MSQAISISLIVLSFINIIFIGLFVYLKKRNLALGLAFLQIILVALSVVLQNA